MKSKIHGEAMLSAFLFLSMLSVSSAMTIGQNILWFPHNEGWGQNWDLFASGVNLATSTQPFKTTVISELQPFSMLRFMDGSMIVINHDTTWMMRRQKTDNTQNCDWGTGNNGIAYEWQILLCNLTGRDYWVNIPTYTFTAADAHGYPDYALRLAILIRTGVDMKAISLTSMMNDLSTMTAGDFVAAGGVKTCDPLDPSLNIYIEYSNETWADPWDYLDQTVGSKIGLDGSGATGLAGLRSAASFHKVYGANDPRIRLVLAGQLDNVWHCQQHIIVMNSSNWNPERIKAYGLAVASYYTGSTLAGFENGTNAGIRNHRNLATTAGIKLLCYEGGTDGNGNAGTRNAGNPRLATEYPLYLAGLAMAGVDEFCHYGYEGANGWGSKDSIGEPLTTAYKYNALLAYAQTSNPPSVLVQPRSASFVEHPANTMNVAADIERFDIRGRMLRGAARSEQIVIRRTGHHSATTAFRQRPGREPGAMSW